MTALKTVRITTCEATDCSYNRDSMCHASAITVGDGAHAQCDTYLHTAMHGGVDDVGAVGACKVSACKFNQSLECSAGQIRVGRHENHADCRTYSPK